MGSVPGDRLTCRKVEAHASAKLERKIFKIITKFRYFEAKIFDRDQICPRIRSALSYLCPNLVDDWRSE